MKNNKEYLLVAVLIASLSFNFAAWAISPTQLPASVRPETLQKAFGPENLEPTESSRSIPTQPQTQPSQSATQATGIKFKMTRVVIEGNTVYSYQQLLPLFAKKINTVITVSDLFKLVENITNFYRNNGYILSRAILPPQHVEDGTVVIRVIEGFIQNVAVVGSPKGAKKLASAHGKNISSERPLRVQTMEKYLLLANEIPGTTVRAVLAPSKATVGASDLNLATYNKIVTGYFSYDNYGTRYVGPQETTISLAANSIFRSGDTTQVTYGTTPKGRELRYFDINQNTPIGTDGLRWIFGGNTSKTHPLYTLQQLQISGDARTYYTSLQYPLYRSQAASVTLNAGFNYFDSQVLTILNALLYRDHTRPVQLGINATIIDSWRGNNLLSFNVKKGLNFLGATTNISTSATTSRPGGVANFLKLNYQVSRLQPLFWRLSAFGATQGQYTFNPLLSSEQFGFGGSQLGRGYDSAEVIGDRGVSGSAELRLDFFPGQIFMQTLELYYYYDAGAMWNIKSNPSVRMKSSATSTGLGARFSLLKYLFGNIMVTQPLTKQVAALELIGNGRHPRVFFSLTAQYN